MSFLGEIKRRKVFQVAVVYAVVAWLLVQIVATIESRTKNLFRSMVNERSGFYHLAKRSYHFLKRT